MPVQLVSTPDPLALTKGGRMVFQFSGSGRLAAAGVRATGQLFLAYPVTDGTKLVLRWNGADHTLLFRDAPAAPNEFPTGDGSAAYVDALMAELQSWFPLREAYTLSRNDPTQLPGIILTAKQPGKAWDITTTLPVGTPFGFGNTEFGADNLVRPQYSVYAELWLQIPGTDGTDLDAHYTRVFAPTIETDADGNATFDVGNILHSQLQADFPATWAIPAVTPGLLSERKYYICYGEAYGSPVQVGRIEQDDVRMAFLGGGDYRHRAGGGFDFLGLRNTHADDDAALRYGSLTRYVRPDEPQFLTFLNSRADVAGVLLKRVRTFDDDSTEAMGLEQLSAQPFAYGHKLCFAVGPAQAGIDLNVPQGKSLREYTVQLAATDGTPLSIEYRYILNYDYQPYTRYFAYLNSLGCLDTLATFGKGSSELNRFFEQAEQFVPATYELADGQFVDYNVATQQQVEVATGFRSEAELRGWNDFYRSPSRWRLIDGKALPVSIVSKSIKQAKDGDTLFAHKFEYVYLFRDDFYNEATGEVGLTLPPPPGFTPGGSVTIEVPTLIRSYDDTVPDVVRELTAPIINGFKAAVAWGNHATSGYLKMATISQLFRRTDQPINWPTDIANKPTNRDQAGLGDVPTTTETKQFISRLAGIRPRLTSWLTENEPQ